MSSALANQINMNHFISLMFSASLVAANSSPGDINAFAQTSDFPTGVSSFAIPAEERIAVDHYVMAIINTTHQNDDGEYIYTSEEKGKYGEGRIMRAEGLLVHVTAEGNVHDHTACERKLRGTHGRDLPTEPWIALVKRGRCNFEEKVQHVYDFKAVGVIVYNDKESLNLDKMKIYDKERNITAIFTYKLKGEQLAKLLDSYTVNVSISEGTHGQSPQASINRTSVLFVSISFIVLMIISLVWLIFYYVQRFRYLQTKDKQSRRLSSVAKRIISKIPTKVLRADDKEVDNDCCAVCIEPYKVPDLLRLLPCGHHFHKVCIDPWLLEHRTCPMCKMDILKHYGFVETGSQESILELDLDRDIERADNTSDESRRRNSVSPMPQIRCTTEHHQITHRASILDSDDSEREIQSPNEETPSLDKFGNANNSKNDICVGCLAAALNKTQVPVIVESLQSDTDTESQNYEIRSSSSLPSTFKRLKDFHTTGSCRDYPNKHTCTEHQQPKKHRPHLQTILAHSNSFHCDSIIKNNNGSMSKSNTFNDAPIDYDSQKNIVQNDSESDEPGTMAKARATAKK